MTQDLFPSPWLINTLLDESFVHHKKAELGQQAVPCELSDWLAEHFNVEVLAKRNEPQLEVKFIGPLLAQLGWIAVPQQVITVQGKQAQPDWCLMLETGQDDAPDAAAVVAVATQGMATQFMVARFIVEAELDRAGVRRRERECHPALDQGGAELGRGSRVRGHGERHRFRAGRPAPA